MIKLRTKTILAIAAAATIGSAFSLTIVTDAPAYAISCEYVGPIHNGSDYLDDYGGGSGTYVHTYSYTGSNNQQWCVEQAANYSGLFIHPLNNAAGLCLDDHVNAAGYRIWVYTCNGSEAQEWCWNGSGYLVTFQNAQLALKDNGLYNIVSIDDAGVNKWSSNGSPVADNC